MVEEIVLQMLIKRLGPAGRIISEMLRENQALKQELTEVKEERDYWKKQAEVSRPAKAHSPTVFRFRVLRWEMGEMQIRPKDEPWGKTVPSLRLHIPPDDQPSGPPYWDITSRRLISILLPLLPQVVAQGAYVELKMSGGGWRNVSSVTVRPA